jgi:hypothetical protein
MHESKKATKQECREVSQHPSMKAALPQSSVTRLPTCKHVVLQASKQHNKKPSNQSIKQTNRIAGLTDYR